MMTKQRRLRPSQGGKMDRTSGPAGGMDPSDVPDDAEAAGGVHVASRRQLDALRDWGGFIDPKDVKHAEFHRVDWSSPPEDVEESRANAYAGLHAALNGLPESVRKACDGADMSNLAQTIEGALARAGERNDGIPRFVDPKDVKHAEFHRVEDALARPFVFERFTLRRDTPSGPVICGYEKSDDAFRALAFHSDQDDTRTLFVVDRSGAIYATSRVWNG